MVIGWRRGAAKRNTVANFLFCKDPPRASLPGRDRHFHFGFVYLAPPHRQAQKMINSTPTTRCTPSRILK